MDNDFKQNVIFLANSHNHSFLREMALQIIKLERDNEGLSKQIEAHKQEIRDLEINGTSSKTMVLHNK